MRPFFHYSLALSLSRSHHSLIFNILTGFSFHSLPIVSIHAAVGGCFYELNECKTSEIHQLAARELFSLSWFIYFCFFFRRVLIATLLANTIFNRYRLLFIKFNCPSLSHPSPNSPPVFTSSTKNIMLRSLANVTRYSAKVHKFRVGSNDVCLEFKATDFDVTS